MNHVTIMIGLPKSGKDTWIKQNRVHERVVSADDYFVDHETGEYRFVPEEIGTAHEVCFRNFLYLLRYLRSDIIVNNTNLTNWERAPYVLAAKAYGAKVTFVHLTTSSDECIARPDNGHGVPDETIRRMADRFEFVHPFWLDRPDALIHV